jgi:hypothetical protein
MQYLIIGLLIGWGFPILWIVRRILVHMEPMPYAPITTGYQPFVIPGAPDPLGDYPRGASEATKRPDMGLIPIFPHQTSDLRVSFQSMRDAGK